MFGRRRKGPIVVSGGLVLVVGLALAGAPTSTQAISAGKIEFDKSCYLVSEDPTVPVTGSGFDPGASLQLVLKPGQGSSRPALQTLPITTDPAGGFKLSVPNPGQEVFAEVDDASGDQIAGKTLKATKFMAGYHFGLPHKGPTRVKDIMVLSGSGFAGGQQGTRGGPERLYLHRVGPDGRARTELLSLLRPCGFGGTNRVTGRALFLGGGPKAKVDPGRWVFQFDTKAGYSKATKQKIALTLRVDRAGIVKPGEQTKIGTP